MFFGIYKVNIYIFIYKKVFKVCFFNAVISFYRPAFIKGRIVSRHYYGIPYFIILPKPYYKIITKFLNLNLKI